jgi:hypothetical protein
MTKCYEINKKTKTGDVVSTSCDGGVVPEERRHSSMASYSILTYTDEGVTGLYVAHYFWTCKENKAFKNI